MSKGKKMIVALAAAVMLVSGAVTVYAVSESGEERPAQAQTVLADYEAEEMAVGAYYADLAQTA